MGEKGKLTDCTHPESSRYKEADGNIYCRVCGKKVEER
jgi:hypothetical protein